MNILGAGQRLWTPRRNFSGGGLKLNTSHFAYPFLIAAIGPTNGSGSTPPIFRGPQALSTFSAAFTATTGIISAPTTNEYGAALNFPDTGHIQTGNEIIFGGLTNTSFVGAFTSDGANAAGDCIIRKDGEWTPLQWDAGNAVRSNFWTSVGLETRAYPLTFATNDIVHCGTTLAGTAQTLYQSVNRGAISVASFVSGGNGILASNAGTGLVLGGDEGAVNYFLGKIHFAYFFAGRILSADQIAQLFLDPAALFVPAEPELPAMIFGAPVPPVPVVATTLYSLNSVW